MYGTNKYERINWFLDFLHVDLEIVSLGEKMKLTTDAISIVLGYSSFVFDGKNKGFMLAERWGESILKTVELWTSEDKLKRCQERLKSFFEKMMNTGKVAYTFFRIGEPSTPNTIHFLDLPGFESEITCRMKIPIIENELRLKSENGAEEKLESQFTTKALLDSPIQFTCVALNDEDTLLLYFCQDLDGVPFGSLRQCQECNKWFFHISKKVKVFCSNNCAARKVSRERRKRIKEEEPQKYKKELARGAERARKSYKKKFKGKMHKAKSK